MKKYITLGKKKLEYTDYYLTKTSCVIRFFNTDYAQITKFFGNEIINELIFVDDTTKSKEQCNIRLKVSNIQSESGSIITKKRSVISESYFTEEPINTELTDDSDNIVYTSVFHPAEIEVTEEELTGIITTVILDTPNIFDEVAYLTQWIESQDEQLKSHRAFFKSIIQYLPVGAFTTNLNWFDPLETLIKEQFLASKQGYRFTYDNNLYETIVENCAFSNVTPETLHEYAKKVVV